MGTGKSHTVAALVRDITVKRRGKIHIARVVFSTLLREIRATFQRNAAQSEQDVLRPYLAADLLWIEDLGADKGMGTLMSDYTVRISESLIDEGLENERPSIITSNLSVESLRQSFDERIASRLSTFTIIKLAGRDRRQQQQPGQGTGNRQAGKSKTRQKGGKETDQ